MTSPRRQRTRRCCRSSGSWPWVCGGSPSWARTPAGRRQDPRPVAGAEPSFAEALADGLAAELAAELSSTLTAWSEESSPAGSTSPPPLRGDLPSDAVTVRNLSDQSLSAGRVPHAQTDLTLLDELTSGDVLLGAGRLDEARAAYRSALRTARGAGHPLPALQAMVGAGVGGGRPGGPRRDDGVVQSVSLPTRRGRRGRRPPG